MNVEEINIDKFEKYLEENDFPATKDGILRTARTLEAPEEIMAIFQEVPERKYKTETEVKQELNAIILKQREIGPSIG